jgi:hypothetical protein
LRGPFVVAAGFGQSAPSGDLVEDVVVVCGDVFDGIAADGEVLGGLSALASSTSTRPSLAGSPSWAWFTSAIAWRKASVEAV